MTAAQKVAELEEQQRRLVARIEALELRVTSVTPVTPARMVSIKELAAELHRQGPKRGPHARREG